MRRYAAVTALAAVALVAPVMLLKADVDGNDDGCVDLQDYAIMQNQFTGPACTPREIVSFFAEGVDEFIVVPEVPGVNGFILTDVISQRSTPVTALTFVQEIGDQQETKLSVTVGASGDQTHRGDTRSFHFNSGIPFAAGAMLKVQVSNSNSTQVTLSGYTY
jgi:hypothetical protein